MQINLIQLERTVAEAKAKAANHPAWVRAIERAAQVLRENPYIELLENGDVLFLSATSNTLYQINGKCAAENGQPCKGYTYNNGVCYHRAIKQLIVRYLEAETVTQDSPNAGILIKPQPKEVRVGGWMV
ncbi:MAG: hypothetical protein L0226_14670 [Acidobacteria bacterium]|nr:hypothetical protein [Acidobacteriota bacterium]